MAFENRCPSCVIAGSQVDTARKDSAAFASRAVFAEEMVVVALRMLKRAGKLKATTDDERAAVDLCGYLIDIPAANRRLLHPQTDNYSQNVVKIAQAVLFE